MDDLWPWYENTKHQSAENNRDYKDTLDMYRDQVLTIGTILESNLKYYVPRSQTLTAARARRRGRTQSNTLSAFDDDGDMEIDHEYIAKEGKNLLIKSRTQFQPYRNIRYLRKFAAMFLLGDREIWKDLLKLKVCFISSIAECIY